MKAEIRGTTFSSKPAMSSINGSVLETGTFRQAEARKMYLENKQDLQFNLLLRQQLKDLLTLENSHQKYYFSSSKS